MVDFEIGNERNTRNMHPFFAQFERQERPMVDFQIGNELVSHFKCSDDRPETVVGTLELSHLNLSHPDLSHPNLSH